MRPQLVDGLFIMPALLTLLQHITSCRNTPIYRARAASFRRGGGAKDERLSVSQLGVGGGGVQGACSPENFDFNSSAKMKGNAFKNNKRNV